MPRSLGENQLECGFLILFISCTPEQIRLFDEIKDGSKCAVKTHIHAVGVGNILAYQVTGAGKLFQPSFIGSGHRLVARLGDAVNQRVNIPLNPKFLIFKLNQTAGGLLAHILPHFFHRLFNHTRHSGGWCGGMQQFLKASFHYIALDGFVIARACVCFANIVRITLGAPVRPIAGERIAATIAQHKTAQREIKVNIFANQRRAFALNLIHDFLIGFDVDKRLMLALGEWHIPIGLFQITGIKDGA